MILCMCIMYHMYRDDSIYEYYTRFDKIITFKHTHQCTNKEKNLRLLLGGFFNRLWILCVFFLGGNYMRTHTYTIKMGASI